jgi:DNA-binding beta-propeller fold protein YncE
VVQFALPEKDVFVINVMANPPVQLSGSAGYYATVGTVIFNMAVNPVSGKVYMANTDANNMTRFEGPGDFVSESSPPGPGKEATVRGHLAESHITILDNGTKTMRHINKHIDYSACCDPNPDEKARSLAFPHGMQVTCDGHTLYVAAFGSSKIGVFDTAALENDTFSPDAANHVMVSGGGPSGLVLDEARGRCM